MRSRTKYLLVMLGLASILAAVGVAHASGITAKIIATVDGVHEVTEVTMGATIQLVCTYSHNLGLSGTGKVQVKYSATNVPYAWGSYSDVAPAFFIASGGQVIVDYTPTQVGWYWFRFQIIDSDQEDNASVHTVNQVILPEPATVAGLGIALAAAGVALMLKKPAMPSRVK